MQALAVIQNHAKGAFDMLNKLKKQKESGFTIIEVMIVLAIAGLIMIVVFLAVPALQRSARNNSLDSGANAILTAVGDYVSDNNGLLPATQAAAAVTGTTINIGATGSNTTQAKVGSNTITNFQINGTNITASSAVGAAEVVTGTTASCNANGNGLSGTASTRSYVVLFVAESGSGNILKCIGS